MFLRITLCALFTFPFTNMAFNNTAKPNCPTHCGNVEVPYPFGIGNGTGCSIDDSLHVTCNTSYEPPKLFLGPNNIEIYNISDSEVRIVTGVAFRCYNQDGSTEQEFHWWIQLSSSFKFSRKNKFTVLGCDDYSVSRGTHGGPDVSSDCLGLCSKPEDVPDNGRCSGMGCCQTSIPKGIDFYNATLYTFQNHTTVWPFNRCGYAFVGESGSFVFHGLRDLNNNPGFIKRIEATVPVVVDWVIAPGGGCSDESNVCKENSSCYEVDGGGYRCRCKSGYEGNPYLDTGCQGLKVISGLNGLGSKLCFIYVVGVLLLLMSNECV